MWKITYTINNHHRDIDNFATTTYGSPDTVTGDSVDHAIENLLARLEEDGQLKEVVDTVAFDLDSYDDCHELSIISIDQVIAKAPNDVFEHEAFKSLIKKRRDATQKP